jgi:hypothetical protein
MCPPQALLNKRKTLVLVTIFCLIEAMWSWALIARGVRHRVDPITALFSLLLIFIAVSIAYRSFFWADRTVFGLLAGVGVLIVGRALPLSPPAILALNVAKSSMWTIAGLVCLIALALGFRASRRI